MRIDGQRNQSLRDGAVRDSVKKGLQASSHLHMQSGNRQGLRSDPTTTSEGTGNLRNSRHIITRRFSPVFLLAGRSHLHGQGSFSRVVAKACLSRHVVAGRLGLLFPPAEEKVALVVRGSPSTMMTPERAPVIQAGLTTNHEAGHHRTMTILRVSKQPGEGRGELKHPYREDLERRGWTSWQ